MEDKRNQLLERASNFSFVPGHGPDIEGMSDDEIEQWVTTMESLFKLAFAEKE